MTDQTPPTPPDGPGDAGDTIFGSIEPIEIQEEMERSFLDYAMSVIVSRALPDARDGLKPVHRRILWGMFDQGVRPDRPHVKCARVVGDVMGKYHPHGDQSIYDALVRMGQRFSLRHMLVDPHGNFGSPSDPPAAMRYCVTADTRVQLADGTTPRIGDLVTAQPNSDTDIDLKVRDRLGRPQRSTKFFHSGTHETLRLRTSEGFELTGTPNHPVLVIETVLGVPLLQWRLLEEIEPGSRVVIRREHDPVIGRPLTQTDADLALLAGALVSEGSLGADRVSFNNTDPEFFDAVVTAYDRLVGGPRYRYERQLPSGKTLYELDVQNLKDFRASPLVELLGRRSADKVVPESVWMGGPEIKRTFLQAIFEGDGSCSRLSRSTVQISYSTQSPQLARELQTLLLEFGVVVRAVGYTTGETKLIISNRRDAFIFASRVGFLGTKQRKLISILESLPTEHRGQSPDRIPFLADYIRSEAGRGGREWLQKHDIASIDRWEQHYDEIFSRLNNTEVQSVVEPLVDAGYYYAVVDRVTPAGRQPVYSLRVDSDDHSFITNGFVSHNTECRLSSLAMELLAGIDEDTVDFAQNYDGSENEPVVLPARFPNLLVNGSQGIAVGMATNIPPHNLNEVIAAVHHVLDHPDATPDDLMQFVTGPDFPTGGYLMGRAGILEAYRTGRGSVKIRARAEIVEGDGRKPDQIVVTEIPYQTSIEAIEAKTAELIDRKELDGIRAIRNESAKGVTRLVFDLKRDAPANVILNNLFKHTPLQTNFAVNMVALDDGVPRTLNLRDALVAYVNHQIEVLTRRSEYRLAKARDRAHIVEGLLKAIDMIDAIIALIRGSDDRPAAREGLLAEPFEFSETQAEHILDMPLSRLTRLGRTNLEEELAELLETIAELESILADDTKLRAVIKDELAEVGATYGEPRRSEITFDPGDLDIEDLIDDEELVISMSAKGYIKAVAIDQFRAQGRGGRGIRGAQLRDEDYIEHLLMTTAHAYLLFFSSTGKVYRLKAHEIPVKERTARGIAIVNLLQLDPGESIRAIIDTRDYETNRFLFFATRNGQVKKTRFTEYDSSRQSGLIAVSLKDGDELVEVIPTNGDADIMLFSGQGKAIRFSEADVRPMGRNAAGVRGMRLKGDDRVVSCVTCQADKHILVVTTEGYGKRTDPEQYSTKGRGGQGVRSIAISEKKGAVAAAFMVAPDDEILVIGTGGVIIRTAVADISVQGRDAGGVRVMNLTDGSTVAAVALVSEVDKTIESEESEESGGSGDTGDTGGADPAQPPA